MTFFVCKLSIFLFYYLPTDVFVLSGGGGGGGVIQVLTYFCISDPTHYTQLKLQILQYFVSHVTFKCVTYIIRKVLLYDVIASNSIQEWHDISG